ncbi:MAG: hypothetical protein D6726_00835, partial [Nitrospirae bacterium]
NNLLVLYGDLDRNEKGIKFLLREVYQVEDIFNTWKMRFEIIIKEEQLKAEKLKEIQRAIEEHKGDSPVYIRLRKNGEETLFLMEDGLTPNFGIIDLITNILGEGSVRITRENGNGYAERTRQGGKNNFLVRKAS